MSGRTHTWGRSWRTVIIAITTDEDLTPSRTQVYNLGWLPIDYSVNCAWIALNYLHVESSCVLCALDLSETNLPFEATC